MDKLQTLRQALSYKVAERNKDATGTEFSDAMLSFHNSVSTIMKQIAAREKVFSRVRFETEYDLVWQEGA